MKLAQLLEIQTGVTAVIGGGGKTTLLRVLGEELSQRGSVLLCTTTKILPYADLPCAHDRTELDVLRKTHRLLCAGTPLESGKLAAPDVPMAELAQMFDYVLVEADGSAQRPMKAHADHEPVIPAEANQTILVIGASGFLKPVEEAAHRPELYAAMAYLLPGMAVTPIAAAAVLLKERLHDRVFVNQVEDEVTLSLSRDLAGLLNCPVLAGSLWREEYTVCSC